MQEEVIYRCINPVCARPMPRPVNFCPWCGTAQRQGLARAGVDTEAQGRREAADAANAANAAAAANAGAAAAAAMSGWTDVPLPPDAPPAQPAPPPPQPSPSPPPPPRQHAPQPDPAHRGPVKDTPRPAPAPPSATDFGRSAASGTGSGSPPPRQEVPRPPIPARPPQRKPVQLRWWILALAILWGVWLLARPSPKKIERQIEHAAALARECKGGEAQAELIALRDSRATPAQLERLQKTLNDQSAICTKRRQRNKAWLEASTAADTALDAGSADKARSRLQGFIRRWGEDEKTRALKARIDEAAAREKHPLAVPRDGAGAGAEMRAGRSDYGA